MKTQLRRTATAALTAATLAAGTLVSAVSAQAAAAPDAVPTPIYHMRIRAVLTANNDGSKAATITPAQIKATVDTANLMWKNAGVVFDFDPATDIVKVNNTVYNNDCTVSGTTCDKFPNSQARESYALSSLRDGAPSGTGWAGGRITVFYRYGGDELTCSSGVCTNAESNWNFSSRAGHYVVMMRRDINKHILAHEFGHYFWNKHTFGTEPATVSDAAAKIRAYVAAGNSKDNGLKVFDGDGDESTDTPPDAGTAIWGSKRCDAATTQINIPVTFPDGTSRTYALKPDRRNLMSYFKCDNLGYVVSQGQINRVRSAVASWNRGHLTGKVPNYTLLKNVHNSNISAGRTVVPFTMGYRTALFSYNSSSGAVSTHKLSDTVGQAPTTIWTGTFTTGYTHLVPYTVLGRTHMVLYKAASGSMKIVRFRTDGKGVDTLASHTRSPYMTVLMPFTNPQLNTFLLEYTSNGATRVSKLSVAGALTQVYSGTFTKGYTSMTPFNQNGAAHALLYKSGSGFVKTIRFSTDATSLTTLWESTWSTGWTHFAPFSRGVQQRYAAYKSGSGAVNVDRIHADAKGVTTTWNKPWIAGAKSVSIVRVGALLYTAHYNPQFGLLQLDQITQ